MTKSNKERSNPITAKSMNQRKPRIRLGAFIAVLAALHAIAGCGVQDRMPNWNDGGTSGDQTQETATQTQDGGENTQTPPGGDDVQYEIPQGWQWTDLHKKDAIRADQSPGSVEGPFTKLELLGVTEGGAGNAKSSVHEMFLAYQRDCDAQGQDCAAPPEYKELDIAGVTVYCAISASKAFSPGTSWSSYIAFAKDGKTVGFMLYDRADNQQALLEKVISTITWK